MGNVPSSELGEGVNLQHQGDAHRSFQEEETGGNEHSGSLDINAGTEHRGQLINEDQKVSWLELFFDLIFVTSFDQLAKRLGDNMGAENVIVFLLMFVALWSIWLGNTQFAARFGNQTRLYRWGTVLELLTLGALSLTLRSDVDQTGWLFAAAYAVGRLVLLSMYFLAGRREPAAARFANLTALGLGLSGFLWLASMPTSHTLTLVLWGAALMVSVFTPLIAHRYHHQALPHHDHLPERVGLLQIIALGGIVTEAVAGGRQQEMTVLGQLPTMLALVTCMAIFRLYFDQTRTLPVLIANLGSRGGTLMGWLYAHLPLTIAILMLGVGFGHGIAQDDPHHDHLNLTLVSWSLAAVFISLALVRYTASRLTRMPSLDRSTLALLGGAAASLGLAVSHVDTLLLHAATAALALAAAFITAHDKSTERLGKLEKKLLEGNTEQDS